MMLMGTQLVKEKSDKDQTINGTIEKMIKSMPTLIQCVALDISLMVQKKYAFFYPQLVVFTDRAQGLTVYDNSLLINIDRLVSDDYKGVGEGYTRAINNTFKFKIAHTSKDNFI